jgi:hypothetical protein
MAILCEFGTAPEQKKEGFKGIGTVRGTDEQVLEQFFSDDVRLVRGGKFPNGDYEFFVMVDGKRCLTLQNSPKNTQS